MRGSTPNPIGALLMVVPVLAIPMFAVMGVPQFAPLVASPGTVTGAGAGAAGGLSENWNTREPVRRSDGSQRQFAAASTLADKPGVGESARCGADDLFAPYGSAKDRSGAELSLEAARQPSVGRNGMRKQSDPRGAPASASSPFDDANQVLAGSALAGLPDEALAGYATARDRRAPGNDQVATPRSGRTIRTGNGFAAENPHTEPTSAPLRRFDREPDFTWDKAVQRLKSLGIKKYHLESLLDDSGFSFRCSYTAPDNPRVTRRFEAEAPEPLAAVQIVLDQIEAWRAGP